MPSRPKSPSQECRRRRDPRWRPGARGVRPAGRAVLHLLPALLAGLLVYELVHLTAPLCSGIFQRTARVVAVSALACWWSAGDSPGDVAGVYLRGEAPDRAAENGSIINQAAPLCHVGDGELARQRGTTEEPRCTGWNRTLAACRPR